RWLLVRERTPQSMPAELSVPGMGGRHWTRAQALRHPVFWLMVPMLLGPAAWGTALFFQQAHIAAVKGWSHAGFVALFPLFTATSVLATVVSGWAIDRFGAVRLIPVYLLPLALGFFILWLAPNLAVAAAAMAVLGLATGLSGTLPAA